MVEKMTVSSAQQLPERFKPLLLYDSQEAFFADSAAQMTEKPGNVLCRAPHDGVNGAVTASANGADCSHKLSLEAALRERYGNELAADICSQNALRLLRSYWRGAVPN